MPTHTDVLEERLDRNNLLTRDLPTVIEREEQARNGALEVAARMSGPGRDYDEAVARAHVSEARLKVLNEIRTSVSVRSEPRVYEPNSPHSYFRDLFHAALPGRSEHREAVERLDRYSRELQIEAASGSPEGRSAVRAVREMSRSEGESAAHRETRALTSGSASFGAFVTPAYLLDDYAGYRTFESSFYGQTNQQPLPEYGLTVYVPAFGSGANVAQQAGENTGVANSTPTAAYLTAPVGTLAGEIDLSQAMFDRGSMTDEIINQQLKLQLDTAIDSYMLTTALATAGSVVQAGGSFTTSELWGDLAKAAAQMETTPGTVAAPTHTFLSPSLYSFAASQVDTTGRPVFLPSPANAALPIRLGPDGRPPAGYTGDRLVGTETFRDGNLPANTIVVADPREVFSFAGAPVVRSFPETFAQDLTVVVQLYAYVACLPRYPKTVQAITGPAYSATQTFA